MLIKKVRSFVASILGCFRMRLRHSRPPLPMPTRKIRVADYTHLRLLPSASTSSATARTRTPSSASFSSSRVSTVLLVTTRPSVSSPPPGATRLPPPPLSSPKRSPANKRFRDVLTEPGSDGSYPQPRHWHSSDDQRSPGWKTGFTLVWSWGIGKIKGAFVLYGDIAIITVDAHRCIKTINYVNARSSLPNNKFCRM